MHAHMCGHIECDYQDLKQDLGVGRCEGHSWSGFHHHASLAIAAYGFLMAQRLKAGSDGRENQKTLPLARRAFPRSTSLGVGQGVQRHVADSITTLRLGLSVALTKAPGHCPHCNCVNLRLY
jgi:hypothetical protein